MTKIRSENNFELIDYVLFYSFYQRMKERKKKGKAVEEKVQ